MIEIQGDSAKFEKAIDLLHSGVKNDGCAKSGDPNLELSFCGGGKLGVYGVGFGEVLHEEGVGTNAHIVSSVSSGQFGAIATTTGLGPEISSAFFRELDEDGFIRIRRALYPWDDPILSLNILKKHIMKEDGRVMQAVRDVPIPVLLALMKLPEKMLTVVDLRDYDDDTMPNLMIAGCNLPIISGQPKIRHEGSLVADVGPALLRNEDMAHPESDLVVEIHPSPYRLWRETYLKLANSALIGAWMGEPGKYIDSIKASVLFSRQQNELMNLGPSARSVRIFPAVPDFKLAKVATRNEETLMRTHALGRDTAASMLGYSFADVEAPETSRRSLVRHFGLRSTRTHLSPPVN